MNFWINDFRGELLETIKDWDFLLINDSEAKLLAGESNLKRAAAVIRAMGPKILVIKRGEYGATLFHDGGHFSVPGYMLDTLKDPTGAGDCFAGGFIGYLASQGVSPLDGTASERPGAGGGVRVSDGQLLLRGVQRGPFPHAEARGDRCTL
jgi:sugar/nucleoside kinase (ribokinase family)